MKTTNILKTNWSKIKKKLKIKKQKPIGHIHYASELCIFLVASIKNVVCLKEQMHRDPLLYPNILNI